MSFKCSKHNTDVMQHVFQMQQISLLPKFTKWTSRIVSTFAYASDQLEVNCTDGIYKKSSEDEYKLSRKYMNARYLFRPIKILIS